MVVAVADDGGAGGEEGGDAGAAEVRLGIGNGEGNVRGFPAVGTEEEVDNVVVHVDVAFQVGVNHLANGRCSVYSVNC